jgi:hypothetical protein
MKAVGGILMLVSFVLFPLFTIIPLSVIGAIKTVFL